ncbi:hypothetical protein N2152v2_008168 [Parachlorella kessleri]
MGDYGDHGGYGGRRASGGYGGHHGKRKRESEVFDPLKQLLHSLIYLGDDVLPGLEVDEKTIGQVVTNIKREARTDAAAVQAMLVDCAVELSTKLPLYALLLGLLNVDDHELVGGVVSLAASQFSQCLQPGGNRTRARLLLRLLAALVVPSVLHAGSVVDALQGLVERALSVAQASPEGDDGRSWQPYTDQLVYWALAALPWGGPELAEAAPEKLQALMASVDGYMAKRPRSHQPSLRPFFAAVKDEDIIAESDNGGASFLGEVVEAVKEMIDSNRWELEAIPRVHLPHEAQLGTALLHDVPAGALEAPAQAPVAIPEGAPSALVGALVLEALPPRGVLRLLDPQHTQGERPKVERLVAEEYILDTVEAFESDRVECAKRLAGGLPLSFPYEALLCELLFGQLLRIPRPRHKPIFYSALMVDLCKLMKVFPRAMSACVRETFARMNVLDVTLRSRLAEWLAYHLSNFEYVWPWERWAHVLAAPPYDGQRRFCVAVMNRLVRLSYWDRVLSVLPEEFRALLPPKPEVGALPAANDEASEDEEGRWAAKLVQLIRTKPSAEDLDAWIVAQDPAATLGASGALGVLRMLARALLVAGAKSYTHMVIALERYYGPLAARVQEAGLEGEVALVDVACAVWRRSPQRAAMAVDRLMTLRLASAEAIVQWVFGSEGVLSLADESSSATSWEILYNAINKTIAREQDARDDLAGAQAQLEAAAGAGAGGDPASVAQAQEAREKAAAYLEETQTQQEAAFLQVLRSLVALLSQDPAGGGQQGGEALGDEAANGAGADAAEHAMPVEDAEGAAAMETEERGAWRDYTHACLKSFVRRYNIQVAKISPQIEQQVLTEGTRPEVREAILSQLYL